MRRPAAVTCKVNPVNPVAPWPSTHEVSKPRWVTPNMVAASPAWKLATVLQISAEGLRSSTKKVSSPVPPTRKFDPVDPSSTLLPFAWLTSIASSPEPRPDRHLRSCGLAGHRPCNGRRNWRIEVGYRHRGRRIAALIAERERRRRGGVGRSRKRREEERFEFAGDRR